MQLDALLEVSIGIVLTWLILSMATSQLQGFITEMVGWRSKFLEARLWEMLRSKDLMSQLYNHPLIQSLNAKTIWGKERKPANIPNGIFAKAAVDVFLNAGKEEELIPANSMNTEEMLNNINNCSTYLEKKNDDLARTVKHLVPQLGQELESLTDNLAGQKEILNKNLAEYRGNVELWFDNTMRQATTLYRNYAALIALAIGIILASIFNVDSLHIVNQLWRDPTQRQAIVAQAGNVNTADSASFEATMAKLDELSLPVGWNTKTTPQNQKDWTLKIFGILLTGLAASQGAPFWFDILRKLTGIKTQSEKETVNKTIP
jgi:hypothetical protein